MGAHVHKTTYRPLIDMALHVMLFMWANPLLGQVGGGWVLEILIFWGPKKTLTWRLYAIYQGPKKYKFQGPTPSHLPS
jgi:hypothetical protein